MRVSFSRFLLVQEKKSDENDDKQASCFDLFVLVDLHPTFIWSYTVQQGNAYSLLIFNLIILNECGFLILFIFLKKDIMSVYCFRLLWSDLLKMF